jgi:hypothetical protein
MSATTCPNANVYDVSIDMPPSVRVEGFLECVETKRRDALRLRFAAMAVGVVMAVSGYLSSTNANRMQASEPSPADTNVVSSIAGER